MSQRQYGDSVAEVDDPSLRLEVLLAHVEHQAKHNSPVTQHTLNELRALKAWYDNQNATGDNT